MQGGKKLFANATEIAVLSMLRCFAMFCDGLRKWWQVLLSFQTVVSVQGFQGVAIRYSCVEAFNTR